MTEPPLPTEDDKGLNPVDRPRALGLIFKRHGRENVRPTVPTTVEIFRDRTGMLESWEVIAWLPRHSEFVAWRRDTNYDRRLKAKELFSDSGQDLDGTPVAFADIWNYEPIDDDDHPSPDDDPTSEETFLRALDLGLTEPNSAQLERYGK